MPHVPSASSYTLTFRHWARELVYRDCLYLLGHKDADSEVKFPEQGLFERGFGLSAVTPTVALSTSPMRVARSSTLFGGRSKGMLRVFGLPCAAYLVLASVAAVVKRRFKCLYIYSVS
jgi:hypothetical protein